MSIEVVHSKKKFDYYTNGNIYDTKFYYTLFDPAVDISCGFYDWVKNQIININKKNISLPGKIHPQKIDNETSKYIDYNDMFDIFDDVIIYIIADSNFNIIGSICRFITGGFFSPLLSYKCNEYNILFKIISKILDLKRIRIENPYAHIANYIKANYYQSLIITGNYYLENYYSDIIEAFFDFDT